MNDFSSTFAAINEFGQVDYAPHNKGITPVFFVEPVLDQRATEQEGRTIYRDMERVRIYIAGDNLSAATHPVDAGIIARFHEQYTAWKSKRTGMHINGVPLSKWPMATPAMIRECEFLNIYSVEDLAMVSDSNVSNLSEGRAVREKAIAWLKSATDGAAVMRYAAENERLRDDLKTAMARLSNLEKHIGMERERRLSPLAPPLTRADLDKQDGIVPKFTRRTTKKTSRKSSWTPERRAEIGARLKAGREAKKAMEIGISRAPDYPD